MSQVLEQLVFVLFWQPHSNIFQSDTHLLNKKYITELGLNINGLFAEGAIALG